MDKKDIKRCIEEFINKNMLVEASSLLEEYKNLFGNEEEIASMEAIVNIYKGNYEEALNNIRVGLKLNIYNSDLYFTMGNVYELTGSYDRAYLCYEQASFLCKMEENKKIIENSTNNLVNTNDIKVRKISIIIVTHNNLEYTQVCLNSIKNYNKRDTYEIIFVDNNSSDGTREWLKEQMGVKLILNDVNVGFPSGCNQGIEEAEKDNDIFLLDNDTFIMPNSIFNLRMALYSRDNIGATGEISNSGTYYQHVDVNYDDFDDCVKFGIENNISNEENYEERLKLVGVSMLIKREALNKVGLLDERFTSRKFQDDDLSIRIYFSGYKMLLCRDAYIHHFKEAAFNGDIGEYNSLLEENKRKFYDKWGFDPIKGLMIYNECENYINKKDKNVLEVFCGLGSNLLNLSQKHRDKKYYAYDENKKLTKLLKMNDFNIIDSLENVEYEDYFDEIIISDYKNIIDDKEMLNNIARCCNKDNGKILIIMDSIKYDLMKLDVHDINKIKALFSEFDFVIMDEKTYKDEDNIITNYLYLKKKNKRVVDNTSKSMFPLLSVIVNCKENQINDIVDSIFEQSYINIEIVVMSQNMKSIKNENVMYYAINNNITSNENIDRAIRISNGKYFTVIDGSVLQDNEKLKKMMEFHQKNDLALVYDGINGKDEIIKGSDASNYIANNIIELTALKTLGIINKEYYINQYGAYFNKKFEFFTGISTYCSCLKYGNVAAVGKSNIYEQDRQFVFNQLCESLILIKELKEERIFISSNEYIKITERIYKEIYDILGNNITKEVREQIYHLKEQYKINTKEINFYNFGFNTVIRDGEEIICPECIDIGNNTLIKEASTLMIPYYNKGDYPRIVIGNNCDLGKRVFISATNKVVIEDNCILASNIHITDHNHEYRKVGIPIREQGVTSFTNEVIIGAGSWIANNCVIVGDVKIGRGCVIGANSTVINDIPDYCVAVGNPAKVKKYFDKEMGKWIAVGKDWSEEEHNKKVNNMNPLLTIGIPTYNRSYFLEKCLDNIYKQVGNDNLVEVLVSDNASNDATKKVVERYKQKYKNLRYNRNSENLGLMGNTRKVYQLSRGKFINAHGDDDYYSQNIIYQIIDTIFNNNDSSIIYTLPKQCEYSVQNGYGIDEYVKVMSFMTTFVTGLIIKNDKYKEIKNKTKYHGTELDLVYFQMELLKNKEKFTIVQAKILNNESGQHKQTGNPYNFGKVFIEYYLDILLEYLNKGLNPETLKEEKAKLINNMIIPWVKIISNNQAELAINNFEEIYIKYFKDESYFEEKLDVIRQLLKDKDI